MPSRIPRLADNVRITGRHGTACHRSRASRGDRRGDLDPGFADWVTQRLAAALPASERDRKRTLLERATRRAHGGAEHAADLRSPVYELGQIAEGWLNLGEVEKARALIRRSHQIARSDSPAPTFPESNFLATAARIELDRVLSLVKDATRPVDRQYGLAAVAESLANAHPAEAERVFQLLDNGSATPALRTREGSTRPAALPGWRRPIRIGCGGSSPG